MGDVSEGAESPLDPLNPQAAVDNYAGVLECSSVIHAILMPQHTTVARLINPLLQIDVTCLVLARNTTRLVRSLLPCICT